MSEHPTIRCPECGLGACDIAPDFDPFAFGGGGLEQTVFASCAAGHRWFEFAGPLGLRGQSGVIGTTGWADNSPHREAQ